MSEGVKKQYAQLNYLGEEAHQLHGEIEEQLGKAEQATALSKFDTDNEEITWDQLRALAAKNEATAKQNQARFGVLMHMVLQLAAVDEQLQQLKRDVGISNDGDSEAEESGAGKKT